jgi:hypothetical protein
MILGLPEGARHVPLTKGLFAIVDEGDFDRVSRLKWRAAGALSRQYAGSGSRTIWMHRFIIDAPATHLVDHINGLTLDNRRSNLRICTHAENSRNRKCRSHSELPFRGVVRRQARFYANIWAENRRLFLGSFQTAEEAAHAYDAAAKKFYGEFACLNFPEDQGARSAVRASVSEVW